MWVDAAAAARHTGVPESTLRRWARQGKVRRRGTMYEYKSIALMVRAVV